jgi:hypothetical protein
MDDELLYDALAVDLMKSVVTGVLLGVIDRDQAERALSFTAADFDRYLDAMRLSARDARTAIETGGFDYAVSMSMAAFLLAQISRRDEAIRSN